MTRKILVLLLPVPDLLLPSELPRKATEALTLLLNGGAIRLPLTVVLPTL